MMSFQVNGIFTVIVRDVSWNAMQLRHKFTAAIAGSSRQAATICVCDSSHSPNTWADSGVIQGPSWVECLIK